MVFMQALEACFKNSERLPSRNDCAPPPVSGAAELQRQVPVIVNIALPHFTTRRHRRAIKTFAGQVAVALTVALIESGLLDGSVMMVVMEPTPYHDAIVAQAHLIDVSI